MSKDDDTTTPNDELLAELFANVTPRSKPPAEAQDKAFAILELQWRNLAIRRKRRNQFVSWSIAASLLLAVGIAFNWLGEARQPAAEPVAKLERITGGTIYANNVKIDGSSRSRFPLAAGETLVTGPDSRAALSWNSGGSLRIDENSEVRFTSATVVQLVSGAIYFDSLPYDRTESEVPVFSIETVAGRISHVGTQFLTSVVGSTVTIGVREGQVLVDGPIYNSLVQPRDRISITADGLQSKRLVEPFDESWHWVEEIAPAFDPNGRTVREMVVWISRETGRPFQFRSRKAEMNAASASLVGLENLSPLQAMRTMQYATDLRYDIVNEEIVIRLSDEQIPNEGGRNE